MKNRRFVHVWLVFLPFLACAESRPFTGAELPEIEAAFDGEPFIVVVWELSCAPCHAELAMLGRIRQEHPGLNLVLLGTDPLRRQPEVDAVLAERGLAGIQSWIFAADNVERLRFSIDPDWHGELPRNYLYAEDGTRIGISGRLDEERVREWLGLD